MPILKSSDVEIYYETSGSGDPIIFIQGVGVVGAGWAPQVRTLEKKFNAITLDNRGIGKSGSSPKPLEITIMATDVLSVMDHLKVKSAHIVGHSMGGSIAIELALLAPERVRSLALLCTFAKGRQATQLNSRIFWLGLRTRIGSKKGRRKAFLEILYSRNFLRSHSNLENLAEETGRIVGRDLAISPPIVMKQLSALSRHDRSKVLGKIGNIRALVVSAAEDPIARPEYGRELAAKIPGAQFIKIEKASHGIVLERPDEINALLERHFERA